MRFKKKDRELWVRHWITGLSLPIGGGEILPSTVENIRVVLGYFKSTTFKSFWNWVVSVL